MLGLRLRGVGFTRRIGELIDQLRKVGQSMSPIVAARWGGSTFSAWRPLLRLGAEPRRTHAYRALVQVLQRGGPCAKALVHSTEIPDELIQAFATLDVSFRPCQAQRISAHHTSYASLDHLPWRARILVLAEHGNR